MTDAERFLHALAGDMPDHERLILCGFDGDPDDAIPSAAWRPRPWAPGREIPFGCGLNAYVTTASFRRAADNTWRRRAECFAAPRAFMVDDVGTKVPWSVLDGVPFSASVETSTGNHQVWFFMESSERDQWRFDGLLRAFIERKLAGKDPGMAGVTRVGRLPGFTNGKKRHAGFRTRLVELHPQRRFTVDLLLHLFGLQIIGTRRPRAAMLEDDGRIDAWKAVYLFLKQHRMLKRDEPDAGGWIEMTCPWVDNHTAGADNGAALRVPSDENDYFGAFRCHHGGCQAMKWRDLTDYVNEIAIEETQRANDVDR